MPTPVNQRPRFSEDEAQRFARDLYNVDASASELPSERDQNFLLSGPGGPQYVLKLSNPGEEPEFLELQHRVIERLHDSDSAFRFPRVCETTTHQQITSVKDSSGTDHYLRLLTFLPGVPLADVRPHSQALLEDFGSLLGSISEALDGFFDMAAQREFKWNLRLAPVVIRERLRYVADRRRRKLVETFVDRFAQDTSALLPQLRTSVIHNDGNDYNVIAGDIDAHGNGPPRRRIAGIVDFGDLLYTYTVGELAIGLAYIMLGKSDPLAAARDVVRGFHETFPLTPLEIEALFPLACMRLCMSVCIAAEQTARDPENEYLEISELFAWQLLERLGEISSDFVHCSFRHSCGLEPCPSNERVVGWLTEHRDELSPVVEPGLLPGQALTFDLSVGSAAVGTGAPGTFDTAELTDRLFGQMQQVGAEVGIGRYDECRAWYGGKLFEEAGNEVPQRRTLHLGIDLFLEPGALVFAPLAGTIHSFRDNDRRHDYGPTILMEHDIEEAGLRFYTLYGHLSPHSLEGLERGQQLAAGQPLGHIGKHPENGDWPPHLHFQLIIDLLGRDGEFPGVAVPSERDVWLSICPDPNLILGIPQSLLEPPRLTKEQIEQSRKEHIGPSLKVSYERPLEIVRGHMQYLYDESGQPYLDAVNNVPHVGHSHPRVVEAASAQNAILNTNTRYLHENLVRYAERLSTALPDPLEVCYFVCSGSEANELALRMARAHTSRTDVVVVDGAYHGNTSSLIDLSPYKHDGLGGKGAPEYVHTVPMPDPYRGTYKGNDPKAGAKFAEHVGEAAKAAKKKGGIAAFFCEPLLGCGGQIVPPDGYMREAYRHVREAGGVCVADEVQIGFGRVGTHIWAFEAQGVVPDIVTLGKPMGNGYPLAAVITTKQIANSFDNGMEYFNTFGGNPVACAVGLAVLDVLEEERLQDSAARVGEQLKAGLSELMFEHPLIGDVRGVGLYLGVELVRDRKKLEPASAEASYVVNRMKEHGILLSTDGPLDNVLKIKPPMVFDEANADRLVETLDGVLEEDYLRAAASDP